MLAVNHDISQLHAHAAKDYKKILAIAGLEFCTIASASLLTYPLLIPEGFSVGLSIGAVGLVYYLHYVGIEREIEKQNQLRRKILHLNQDNPDFMRIHENRLQTITNDYGNDYYQNKCAYYLFAVIYACTLMAFSSFKLIAEADENATSLTSPAIAIPVLIALYIAKFMMNALAKDYDHKKTENYETLSLVIKRDWCIFNSGIDQRNFNERINKLVTSFNQHDPNLAENLHSLPNLKLNPIDRKKLIIQAIIEFGALITALTFMSNKWWIVLIGAIGVVANVIDARDKYITFNNSLARQKQLKAHALKDLRDQHEYRYDQAHNDLLADIAMYNIHHDLKYPHYALLGLYLFGNIANFALKLIAVSLAKYNYLDKPYTYTAIAIVLYLLKRPIELICELGVERVENNFKKLLLVAGRDAILFQNQPPAQAPEPEVNR